ncbi:MAG: adenylate/guanylate cyclase domain-containing protein [Actinomycetota bacterium]
MDIPQMRYAQVGDSQIAYQIFGEGPSLMFIFGFLSHLDLRWEEPQYAKFMHRLASFSSVIVFDRRGVGASDPLPDSGSPSWEDWVTDIGAVLDAEDIKQTALLASNDAGPSAMLFAATYPERVTSLILTNTGPRLMRSDEYPFGLTQDTFEVMAKTMEEHWGKDDGVLAEMFVPDQSNDRDSVKWYAKLQRATMTPRRVGQMMRILRDIDALSALPLIQAPTLVVGLSEYPLLPPEGTEFLAKQIPDASTLILTGRNASTWLNEPERYLSAIQQHVLGRQGPVEVHRVLATVLFTDIVGSTAKAVELGDAAWSELLDRHDELARRSVARFSGRLVKSTGDGVLATFDGAARAVRCAAELTSDLATAGIQIRSGLHAGEVELRGDDVSGIAVHIAVRIQDLAAPQEVLVSGTVKDLVVGSNLAFEERGRHQLKGAPNEWPVFAFDPRTSTAKVST